MSETLRKASLVVSFHRNDKIFDIDDPVVNRDNITRQWYELRQEFRRRGYHLATSDLHPPKQSRVVLYHDVPAELPSAAEWDKSFLLTMEPPVVKAPAWDEDVQRRFRKVLTWNDNLVDGKDHVKIRYGFQFPDAIPKDVSAKRKLCTTIIGRKRSKVMGELYSERLRAVYWFERHHPDEFDFYGFGWEGKKGPLARRLLATFVGAKPLSSYRGLAGPKLETYRPYRFAICYENCRMPGYVTEKIFDCFFAGVVPIYLGAPNIQRSIPTDCFIDRLAFSSYRQLYGHLKSIDDNAYRGYLDRIEAFVLSDLAKPYHATTFAKTVADAVLDP